MKTQQNFFAQYFARQNGYTKQDLDALHSNAYQALCLPLTLTQLENTNVQALLKNRTKACVSLLVYAHGLGFTNISIEDVAEFESQNLAHIISIMQEA